MQTVKLPIVGNKFRDEREQAFFSDLQSDPSLATLYLEHESDNEHDPMAIRVMARTVGTPVIECHLGYIPRNLTSIIHRAWEANSIIEKELIANSNVMSVTIRDASQPSPSPKPEEVPSEKGEPFEEFEVEDDPFSDEDEEGDEGDDEEK